MTAGVTPTRLQTAPSTMNGHYHVPLADRCHIGWLSIAASRQACANLGGEVLAEKSVGASEDEGVDNGAELCAALLGQLGLLAGCIGLPAP